MTVCSMCDNISTESHRVQCLFADAAVSVSPGKKSHPRQVERCKYMQVEVSHTHTHTHTLLFLHTH